MVSAGGLETFWDELLGKNITCPKKTFYQIWGVVNLSSAGAVALGGRKGKEGLECMVVLVAMRAMHAIRMCAIHGIDAIDAIDDAVVAIPARHSIR